MDDILDRIIADFHGRDLPALTRRRAKLPWLKGKIDSVIGMRRSGKTWFMYQTMSDLIFGGHARESILYMNFEDDRLAPMTAADLQHVEEAYYRRYPRLRGGTCSFFLDEIHSVPGWERFARRLCETEGIHLCISGSSSKLLSSEIATTLRGRSIPTEIFPFSFPEFLEHTGIDASPGREPSSSLRSLIENRFDAYLLTGGFPEIQSADGEIRTRILQEYLDVVILRDVIERRGVTNPVALRHLIRHLLSSPSSPFSVSKFYKDLRSRGVPVGKDTLHEYLEHLCDAFLLFPVEIRSRSMRRRHVNPRKIYAVDTGLVLACSPRATPDLGQLLENVVFLELRRRGLRPDYFRTRSGREVDFVVEDRKGRDLLVQSCASIRDPQTREREVASLTEAMREIGLRIGTIVTVRESGSIDSGGRRIRVVPAWRWILMELDESL